MRNMTPRWFAVLGSAVVLVLLALCLMQSGTAAFWKGAPRWNCQVTFRDALGDVIKSDQRGGPYRFVMPYRDGENGVSCGIAQDAASPAYNTLTFDVAGGFRWLHYASNKGSTGAGYDEFDGSGGLLVKALADVPPGGDAVEMRPVRAYAFSKQFTDAQARFEGDCGPATASALVGTSSAIVQATSACSWVVTFDAAAPFTMGEHPDTIAPGNPNRKYDGPRVLRLQQGSPYSPPVGDFVMPFQVEVQVIGASGGAVPCAAGVK